MRLNIGCPVVRTDGRGVYGHVITKFSGKGRFTYPWSSAGALRAPGLRYEGETLPKLDWDGKKPSEYAFIDKDDEEEEEIDKEDEENDWVESSDDEEDKKNRVQVKLLKNCYSQS